MESQVSDIRTGTVHSVQSLAATDQAFTEGGLRWDIFQNKDELLQAGAIFYIGNKLNIDRDRYIAHHKNETAVA